MFQPKDIFEIDKEIRNNLYVSKEKELSVKKKLFELKHSLRNCNDNKKLKKYKEKKIELNNLLKTKSRYDKYCFLADPILKKYKTIRSKTVISSFVSKKDDGRKEEALTASEFRNVAVQFCSTVFFPEGCNVCDCGGSFANLEGVERCVNCGESHFEEALDIYCSIKKPKPKGNFSTVINKFMGKTGSTPPSVITEIKNLMKERGVQNNELSKAKILEYLKILGKVEHIEDVSYIYFKITRRPLHDIESYREKLLEYYDEYHNAYLKVQDQERHSSLRPMYILFKLLQILGYNCSSDDIKMLKSIEKIKYHDEKHRQICDITKWKYIPTV